MQRFQPFQDIKLPRGDCILHFCKCIPLTGSLSTRRLSQPYKDKPLFWHCIWVEGGLPREGRVCIAQINGAICRVNYYSAIRSALKQENEVIKGKIAECIQIDKHRNIWLEIRKLRNIYNCCQNKIDNNQDQKKKLQLVAKLFPSVPTPADDLASTLLCWWIIQRYWYRQDIEVTPVDIQTSLLFAVLSMTTNDGEGEITSDCFNHAYAYAWQDSN